MDFLSFLEKTSAAQLMQETSWVFPIVSSMHLISIVFVMGYSFLLNWNVWTGNFESTLYFSSVRKIFLLSIIFASLSGAWMFVSEATGIGGNPVFLIKVIFFFLALCYEAGLRGYLKNTNNKFLHGSKIGSLLSILIWTVLIALGRWIAYY